MGLNLSADVLKVLGVATQVLGETFSFEALVNFTELYRGKPLHVEQDAMPVAMTGYCLALRDSDLICTRVGLDAILMRAVRLHEIAHLLLGHIPQLSSGPSTPSYGVFLEQRDLKHALARSHMTAYNAPQEYDAEMLATLLLQCISRENTSIPRLARELQM